MRRAPFLEKCSCCNLARLSRLLRILRFHAHELKLVPAPAVYLRHGKGHSQALRFTKTGDARLEARPARGPSCGREAALQATEKSDGTAQR
jgi:hypothetical protein